MFDDTPGVHLGVKGVVHLTVCFVNPPEKFKHVLVPNLSEQPQETVSSEQIN